VLAAPIRYSGQSTPCATKMHRRARHAPLCGPPRKPQSRLFSDLIGGIMGIPGPQKVTFGEMADSGAWRDTRGHSPMMSIGSDSGIAQAGLENAWPVQRGIARCFSSSRLKSGVSASSWKHQSQSGRLAQGVANNLASSPVCWARNRVAPFTYFNASVAINLGYRERLETAKLRLPT
jgi:hypothetical protein